MNGILVIVLGVAVLYLVISGKLDCFIKAMQACGKAATDPAATTTATPAGATPSQTLDRVLSPTI